ncbi:MAG: flagellar hook assembly protein FlgD [Chromatiales bacterium]|nr:flagellar hook assembly protein FlgD [Chromatiales bacterium]
MTTTNTDVYQALGYTQRNDPQASTGQGELAMSDFLNLMVTELTHQDPMKPMDNAQLASQISQFATVSGLEQLNTSFSDLSAQLVSNQALEASNLVGRDVLIPAKTGYLGDAGSSISGIIGVNSSASDVKVRITDESGALVKEISLGNQSKGEVNFTWDGMNEAGEVMPAGQYEITAEATVEDETIAPYVLLEANVSSVSLDAQGLNLNLEGLGMYPFNQVAEIR